jgi:hypothetical protein
LRNQAIKIKEDRTFTNIRFNDQSPDYDVAVKKLEINMKEPLQMVYENRNTKKTDLIGSSTKTSIENTPASHSMMNSITS